MFKKYIHKQNKNEKRKKKCRICIFKCTIISHIHVKLKWNVETHEDAEENKAEKTHKS